MAKTERVPPSRRIASPEVAAIGELPASTTAVAVPDQVTDRNPYKRYIDKGYRVGAALLSRASGIAKDLDLPPVVVSRIDRAAARGLRILKLVRELAQSEAELLTEMEKGD